MGKIVVMQDNLINKIAAGEVVEKICNVVKELVENSIDAGSKNIKIELVESGMKLIKVTDDGCGMSKEDATLCFSRHATSKIKTENDLYFINTLGFRGEALAAIAAVSDVVLDTYDGNESTLINIKAGKILSTKVGSMRVGTIIEVKELFYNTPARLKFLKNPHTELANTVSILEKIALSHPDVAFELFNDEKSVLKTSGSSDLYKTIHEIFGLNTTKNMIKISAENYDYVINGYISNINISKSTRNYMVTLVNGRVVTNQSVNRTIKDAYHSVLADNKYPIVVINIETDPTLVDVNIHPTKQDIKFSKLESLDDLLFSTIRGALNESDNTYKVYKEEEEKPLEVYEDATRNFEEIRLNFVDEDNSVEYKEESVKRVNNLIKPVGLALGTYLIANDEDTMYLIDIHAAAERANYEKILGRMASKQVYITNMLFPVSLEFTKNEYMNIKDNIDIIKDLGFEVEEFGTNTFRVLSHPDWLREGFEEESIRNVFEFFGNVKGDFDRLKFNDHMAATMACKASIKANSTLSYEEMESLINNLFNCKFPYTCPHGRPTIIKYPIHELEKMFKRVNFSKVDTNE